MEEIEGTGEPEVFEVVQLKVFNICEHSNNQQDP